MTRALIIADPQRDICEGGSLGVGGGAAGVSRIDRLLNSDHGDSSAPHLVRLENFEQTRRRYGDKGLPADRVELGLISSRQLDAEPAEMPDVRRPEESLRLGIHHLSLNAIGCGAPDRKPAVVMVVIEKHHKALLPPNEEGGSAMTQPLGRLGQDQARPPHVPERYIDLMPRKPAHAATH